LILLDPWWAFNGPFRDGWIYTGYFLHAPRYLAHELPEYYFGSRLSLWLPGYLAHHFLPLLAANVALRLGLCWLALGAFYGVARRLCGRRPALLAAMAMGCSPFFLLSMGWNYSDGFGIACWLAALWITIRVSLGELPDGAFFLAGALAALMVVANLFYLVLLPFLLWYALAVEAPRPLGAWAERVGWTLAGAVSAVAGLSAVGHALGGPWAFWRSSLRFAFRYATQAKHPVFDATWTWLWGAGWLVLPAAVIAGGFLDRRATSSRFHSRVAVAQLAALFGVLFLVQTLARSPMLQLVYYASLLLPLTFLALASELPQDAAAEWSSPAWAGAGLPLVGAATLPVIPVEPQRWGMAAMLALSAIAVLALGPWQRRRGALALGVGALCALFWLQRAATPVVARMTWGDDPPGTFAQVVAAAAAIDAVGRDTRVWYDLEGPDGRLHDCVAALLNMWPRMVGLDFPRLDFPGGPDGAPLVDGMHIAVLSARPDSFAQARATLRRYGLDLRELPSQRVLGPRSGFWLRFGVIETQGRNGEPGRPVAKER
jgi:hypothetical protein